MLHFVTQNGGKQRNNREQPRCYFVLQAAGSPGSLRRMRCRWLINLWKTAKTANDSQRSAGAANFTRNTAPLIVMPAKRGAPRPALGMNRWQPTPSPWTPAFAGATRKGEREPSVWLTPLANQWCVHCEYIPLLRHGAPFDAG